MRTTANDGGVQIHVLDNGHGIDPRIRDKIFDPFFTTKPPGKGTGLGLSISHGIVEDHGGRIEVEESEAGQGTFHGPLAAATAATSHPARASLSRVGWPKSWSVIQPLTRTGSPCYLAPA